MMCIVHTCVCVVCTYMCVHVAWYVYVYECVYGRCGMHVRVCMYGYLAAIFCEKQMGSCIYPSEEKPLRKSP